MHTHSALMPFQDGRVVPIDGFGFDLPHAETKVSAAIFAAQIG
jgi:hypothetical protein